MFFAPSARQSRLNTASAEPNLLLLTMINEDHDSAVGLGSRLNQISTEPGIPRSKVARVRPAPAATWVR